MTLLEKLGELVERESPFKVADEYCPDRIRVRSDGYRRLADKHPDCRMDGGYPLCVKCWLREWEGDKNDLP